MADETKSAYPQALGAELNDAAREMIAAGVFYGKKKSKTHPRMKAWVLANRGGIEIINLAKTEEELSRAAEFVKGKAKAGELFLFVGTQPAAQDAVQSVAAEFKMPFVVNRWVGGTLTNFKMIAQRVEYMKKLRTGLATGMFDKYTKKERLGIERELGRLIELMAGLEALARVPDALVVIDPVVHETAVREALQLGIPVIALADTDADPDAVTRMVPGNAKSKKSIEWFLGRVKAAVAEGKSAVQSTEGVIANNANGGK
ncbi:MAG: 30S ribosomal protein S2 [Candidatus Liptonbacteria bacterium]|nr:30S ribosomal protein S2 [Candidatus Liptonbacteria bacterium]